jgi:NAD-dependent DNA ligase
MEGFIQANGGEVAKTVTNKCTHLMSSETGTKKCADAEKKGVLIVDEAWVREQCGDAGDQNDEAPPAPKKATKAKVNAKAAAPKAKAKKTAAAAAPPPPSVSTGGALAGLTFCMTGTMRYTSAHLSFLYLLPS